MEKQGFWIRIKIMKKLEEITTLKELWNHPEWKKNSKVFLEGKTCAWNPEHTKGLSPHHIEKHKWALPLYNEVKNNLFNPWWKVNQECHNYDIPKGLTKREIKKRVKFLWSRDNRSLIKESFETKKREILDDYLNLSEEKIIPLCSRCHFARKKGWIICPECKTNYMRATSKLCKKCRSKLC